MLFGLKATVYMVKVSYNQKPYRRVLMELWGADIHSSPSTNTESGRRVLKDDPDNPGSLGIAISEAIEGALTHDDAKYSFVSVLNFVLLHQTVVGLEAKKQMELVDDYPDLIVGCIGGGSSFSGLFWLFYHDKVPGKAPKDVKFLAVEPTACPSITKDFYTYDHGDTARLTPMLKMYTLGHMFIPPLIHAGGLRYHGKSPNIMLIEQGRRLRHVDPFPKYQVRLELVGRPPITSPKDMMEARPLQSCVTLCTYQPLPPNFQLNNIY